MDTRLIPLSSLVDQTRSMGLVLSIKSSYEYDFYISSD